MAAALRRGYAAGSTDTGHGGVGTDAPQWALGHPEKVADFGYRAVHEMTVKPKLSFDPSTVRPHSGRISKAALMAAARR